MKNSYCPVADELYPPREFYEEADFENPAEAREAAWKLLEQGRMVAVTSGIWIGNMPYENNQPVPDKWTEKTVTRIWAGDIAEPDFMDFDIATLHFTDSTQAKEAAWQTALQHRKVTAHQGDGDWVVRVGKITRYLDTGWLIP